MVFLTASLIFDINVSVMLSGDFPLVDWSQSILDNSEFKASQSEASAFIRSKRGISVMYLFIGLDSF